MNKLFVMDKLFFYKEMMKELDSLTSKKTKPSLLLHSCCGPCNTYPMVFLSQYFNLTLYFNNSNIFPYEEYNRRLQELLKYTDYFNNKYQTNIKCIVTPYQGEEFSKYLSIYENEPEGGKRCELCFIKRLNEAYKYAAENNFDYFTTVMSISRNKDSKTLNEIGIKLSSKYPKTKFLIADLKKKDGTLKGIKIANELNMYRQQYCGCLYSKINQKKRK